MALKIGQITSVVDLWKLIKEDLLASSDATYGWTGGPPGHRKTWWCNDNVDKAVKDKCWFWKSSKKGGSKEV